MEQLIDYIRRYLVEHQNEYEAWVKERIMTTKAKAAIIATALITAGILTAGAIWRERIKPEPTDYLTFERVVYSGDSLWSLCERYSGYEDIQTIIMRVREDNGIENPGALQPGQKIKVRVKKLGR